MGYDIQDVDHIKLKSDRLLHGITRDDTALGQTSMIENFLRTANVGQVKCIDNQNQMKLITYS